MSAPNNIPKDIDQASQQDERQRDLALAKLFELDGVDENGSQRSCPDDSVPIRRFELSAFARFHTLDEALSKYPKPPHSQSSSSDLDSEYSDTTTNLLYHDAALIPTMTDDSCYDILLYKSPTWGQYFYFGGGGYSSACE